MVKRKGSSSTTNSSGSSQSINTTFQSSESKQNDTNSCGKCTKNVGHSANGLMCETCLTWFHLSCTNVSKPLYDMLSSAVAGEDNGISWDCGPCREDKRDKFKALNQKIDSLIDIVSGLRSELNKETKKRDEIQENFEKKVKEIINEEKEKDKRKNNIIVHGLPEVGQTKEAVAENDLESLTEFFAPIANDIVLVSDDVEMFRIGQKVDNKIRPIKIKFQKNTGLREKVYKAKKDGKILEKFEKVKVVPDRTRLEAEEYRKLVNELIQRKNNGEKNIAIRGMKIVNIMEAKSGAAGPSAPRPRH